MFFLVNGGSALVQKTQDDMREVADRPWVDVCLALALTHTMDQSKLQLHWFLRAKGTQHAQISITIPIRLLSEQIRKFRHFTNILNSISFNNRG